MTQMYIGIKLIKAYSQKKDGKEGYTVVYDNGYESWSPKDVFEKAYMPMGYVDQKMNDSRVTEEMVVDFMGQVEGSKLSSKSTLVKCLPVTGFEQYEVSSCVDPANYDHDIGVKVATERIKSRIWGFLGFVLQWAKYGLNEERHHPTTE